MHDDVALVKFRMDHDILNVVLIELPGPKEVPAMVQGHGDRIPVWTWLIHQVGLRFSVSPMLNEVMAHCGFTFMQVSLNFVQTVLSVNNMMRREGHCSPPPTC